MKQKSRLPRSGARPDDAGGKLTLATFLPYRLSVVAAVSSEGLAHVYQRRFGLAVPEWRVLATVAEFGTVTASFVVVHTHMNKVKISRATASLQSRGLIARSPNEEDLREAFLDLTPEGRAVYDEIAPLALDYVARLTAAFSPEDVARLDNLLDRLLLAARTMGGQ